MTLVFADQRKPKKEILSKVDKLMKYFHREAAPPLGDRVLGDNVADWARNTWAFQTWSGLTRDEIVAESEKLQYKRILTHQVHQHYKELKENLSVNVYAEIIVSLIEQLRSEGKDALFCFCMANEMAQKRKGTPVYQSLLNFIYHRPDEYGTVKQIRAIPAKVSLEDQEVWQEIDEIRESVTQTLKDDTKEVSKSVIRQYIDDNKTVDEKWREEEGSSRMLPIAANSKLHAHKMVHEKWTALEEKVKWQIIHLIQDAGCEPVSKEELWERQNRIELALKNVMGENPDHPDIKVFREHVNYFRPALRGDMAFLISTHPRLAQKIYEIVENLMICEVDAFGFLEAAAALARTRENDDPLIQILEDVRKPEPTTYTNPQAIVSCLEEAAIYVPPKMDRNLLPLLFKGAVEQGCVSEASVGLVVSQPQDLSLA